MSTAKLTMELLQAPRPRSAHAIDERPSWRSLATSIKRAIQSKYIPAIALALILILFVAIESFVPLKTATQIGADEGLELVKATLCLNGYQLYTQVWNDQPPLHTLLVCQLLKHISISVFVSRLLTVACAVVLLASLYMIVLRVSGLLAATLTAGLLVASPGFIQLSSSCMLEVPALSLALLALSVLRLGHPTRWRVFEIACGILFAVGLQMKLVPLMLAPLGLAFIWLRYHRPGHSLRNAAISALAAVASLLICYVAIDLLLERGAYLRHFQQTWVSHFGGAKSLEYGSAQQHPFQWTVLLKNWDTTVPALIGVIVIVCRRKREFALLLPVTWLCFSLLVFGMHKPWWPYYYIHTAIPLCWCAALGIQALWSRVAPGANRRFLISFAVFSVCALSWMGGRVYLQVAGIRQSPQLYCEIVLDQIKPLKASAGFMFADDPIYSFYTGIPMPPQLAVLPVKRFWAGEMTNAKLAAEMIATKPGVLLLRNDGREVPFQELLNSDYRLAYIDSQHRLYVPKKR